jgi:glyoxylase-like metal-dependent hydrolase (beta-lactamase superfamily II)
MPTEATVHPTAVDVELDGGETIEVGDARFHALATPGHTPGSTCYLVERGDVRALFTGDVVMSLSGANPLGTYATHLAPRYRGDAQAFLSSLRKLRDLPVPDLVLPGHPRQDYVPQNPRLSQRRWEALLDAGIREMETLLARRSRDGANFLDGNPKQLLEGLYYLGDVQGVALYGLFARSKFFLVGAPGGPRLLDFVAAQLRKLGREPALPTAVLLTSGDRELAAGLSELVARSHAQVVASRAALPAAKEWCPAQARLLAAEELPARGWFEVEPIPLGGRGLAPVAYKVAWAGRTVLFSGRIPIKLTLPEVEGVLKEFSESSSSAPEYADSLNRLGELKPDLWLPSRPSLGQNASLYETDWEEILAANRKLLP